jgi:hypothetical protein
MTRLIAAVGLCGALAACAGGPQQAPTVALPAAPPPGEPAGLPGMESSALRVAYGAPAFVRKDGSIEMWRYDNPACKAFFFLYASGNGYVVRHVETVPRGRDMAADEGCLAVIRQHPATTPVS